MTRPFKNKTLRDKLEAQLHDLAAQTDELRKQVADRAPAVRDQIADQISGQTDELRKQVADRAPAVRDQIVSHLPDKGQLLDLRDDLFDRLPENVQDRLPEKVKPQRKRLRRVAAVGILTGAGAAAFAILKRKGDAPAPYVAPVPPPASTTPRPAPGDAVGEPTTTTQAPTDKP
ncbi:hypothetical protein IFT73_17760 [Aeromicrobium sp. CFBP 8757]|uniref:hypothetical protein n=1 Tax=Aeromicrobium sp. CFBP 8757 TaxID=2775288 RepID=UPI00177B5F22|nr:hypothetical protein [Aeromicrobium sp. CFBP 8757]MBD8608705.1 hypothetical protein [Aeromicrobium sp. CFBP 8757]